MKKLIILCAALISVGVSLSTSSLVSAAEVTTNTFNVSKSVENVDALKEEKIYGPIPLNGWGKGPGYTWYQHVPGNPYANQGWWRG